MFGLQIQNKNSTMNTLLHFLFDFFKSKEKYHIRRKQIVKNSVYIRNQYYYYH